MARTVTESDFTAITDVTTTAQTRTLDGLVHEYPKFSLSANNDFTVAFTSASFKSGSLVQIAVTKTIAGNIVLTLSDTNYTHFLFAGGLALPDNQLPAHTGLSGSVGFYTGLVLGTSIWWTDSLSIGSLITAITSSEFQVIAGQLALAALGVTTGKIADAAVTYVKMLGQIGAGERVMVSSNAGAVSSPYTTQSGVFSAGQITSAETESGWSGGVKTISGLLSGQSYYSSSTGYRYACEVDGTCIRIPVGDRSASSALDNLELFGTGSFGGGVKVLFIANATTVPTTDPVGGGILFVEGGALKFRGSSGSVTTLANA